MISPQRKTNAIRLLESRGIDFEALSYDAAIHSAKQVAEVLGVPAGQVYKTLVVLRPTPGARPLLIMVAADREVDLRHLADFLGEKSLRMAPHREAERLTGLLVGGIGALALVGKQFDPVLDRHALEHGWVLVNGGRRGLNVKLSVADLVSLTSASIVEATTT